tara:strand:+ start:758 stop:1036 length:279 start_codon:yes stop_codon:yes gene_type:complete
MTFFNDCIADLRQPDGWEDVSYGNDACPSWSVKGYQVFIDHPDPVQRELGPDIKRFWVQRECDYGEGNAWGVETDRWDEVLETISKPLPNFT